MSDGYKMVDYGNVYMAILGDNRQMRLELARLTAENERLHAELAKARDEKYEATMLRVFGRREEQ